MIFMGVVYFSLQAIFMATGWEYQPLNDAGYYNDGHTQYVYRPWVTLIRGMIFEMFVSAPVMIGFYAAIFEAMRTNSPCKYRTLLTGYACAKCYFLRVACLSLVMGLLIRVGFMLFIIPGVYFSIVTGFVFPLHVDNRHMKLRSWQAIGLSIRTLSRYCCNWFGFVLLCLLINLLGALCLLVGLFVTIPVTVAAHAYCYHHLIGVNGMAVIVPRDAAVAAGHPLLQQVQIVPVPVQQVPPVPQQ